MIKMAFESDEHTQFKLLIESMDEAKAAAVELKGRWRRANPIEALLEDGTYRRQRITDPWIDARDWRRGLR